MAVEVCHKLALVRDEHTHICAGHVGSQRGHRCTREGCGFEWDDPEQAWGA